MAITLNKILGHFVVMISIIGCYTTNETITICNKKYDVYKHTEYDYEQKITSTFNTLCFHNSKLIAFSYQSAGYRNNDSNLVSTVLKHQNDSLVVSTYFNEVVFGYSYQLHRYYKCLENGFISLNSKTLVNKKTARRKKNNYLKKIDP